MQQFSDLSQDDIAAIAHALHDKYYNLLTGSGVSLDSIGPDGEMRSARKLEDRLHDILEETQQSYRLHQIYGLLSPEQVDKELTRHYQCTQPGTTIETLIQYPWRRVYTFNIDNCFEEASRKWLSQNEYPKELIESINYCDDFSDNAAAKLNSVVHLHGSVEHPNDGYIFSYQEYARNMHHNRSWMQILLQLMNGEPFIIAGTSLNEIDVEYYMNSRSKNSESIALYPSILIEPYPNKLTIKTCEEHNFILFEGTTVDFFKAVEAATPELPRFDLSKFATGIDIPDIPVEDALRFDTAFHRVRTDVSIKRARREFLVGAPLDWTMVAGNSDLLRDQCSGIEQRISEHRANGSRIFLIFEDAGAGKTALLKRLAFRNAGRMLNTFWLADQSICDAQTSAQIFDKIAGPVCVYVDDLADKAPFISSILVATQKPDLIFIGIERGYRERYVEDQLYQEDNIALSRRKTLNVNAGESRRLIQAHSDVGIGSIPHRQSPKYESLIGELSGQSISVANCRIQNNFTRFDTIVRGLIDEVDDDSLYFFLIVALSRRGCGTGIKSSIAFNACQRDIGGSITIDSTQSPLPVFRNPDFRNYFIPGRTVIADRVLDIMAKGGNEILAKAIVDVGRQLAPYVIGRQRSKRTPEGILAGGLLDFDRTVLPLAGTGGVSNVYQELESAWGSDSRYREQVALMYFAAYERDSKDTLSLQLAIDSARNAVSIHTTPQSNTTLAKILFNAAASFPGRAGEYFEEALKLIADAVGLETKMAYVSSMAFTVVFRGARTYLDTGRSLTPSQQNQLRDLAEFSKKRKMKDGKMIVAREALVPYIFS